MVETSCAIGEPLPESEDAVGGFSPVPRWIVMAMFIGLLGFIATLRPSYGHFGQAGQFDEWLLYPFWIGAVLFGQPLLLAVWAGLSGRRLAVRWPQAIGLAACLELVVLWASQRHRDAYSIGLEYMVVTVGVVVVFGALLGIVRLRYGWRIVLGRDAQGAATTHGQFSLGQLMLWTAVVAGVLALGRWMTPEGPGASDWSKAGLMLLNALVVGMVSLPLVTCCVGAVLRKSDREWFIVWAVGAAVIALAALVIVMMVVAWIFDSSAGDAGVEGAALAGLAGAGMIVTLVAGLVVLRLCGYRLVRGEAEVAAAADESDGNARAGSRIAFLGTVGAMLLVALALVWPAMYIDQGRRASHADWLVTQQFARLGTAALVYNGRLMAVSLPPGRPVSEGVLELIEKHGGASLGFLDLSGRRLTDEQVEHLGSLTSLMRLHLGGTGISDRGLARLENLKQIVDLDLGKTKITNAGLESVRGFDKLVRLSVRGTRVDGKGLANLADMRELKCLNLCETGIDDEALNQLRQFQSLNALFLDGTGITDAGMAHVAAIKGLQVLSVRDTQVTGQGKADLVRTLPSCRIVPACSEPQPPVAPEESK